MSNIDKDIFKTAKNNISKNVIETLCSIEGSHWRDNDKQFVISQGIEVSDNGLFYNFKTDESGDLIDLLVKSRSITKLEAAELIIKTSGNGSYITKPKKPKKIRPHTVAFDPNDKKIITNLKACIAAHSYGRTLKEIYFYLNEEGKAYFCTARTIKTGTKKSVLPYSMNRDLSFTNKAPAGILNYLPYGFEKLKGNNLPVILVEGEKNSNAKISGYILLSTYNAEKTDWSCLEGREVTIWPDFDYQKDKPIIKQIGFIKAHKLKKAIPHAEIMDIYNHFKPGDVKSGWDIVDAKDEEIDIPAFIEKVGFEKPLQELRENTVQPQEVFKLTSLKNTDPVICQHIYDDLIKEIQDPTKAKNTYENLLTIIKKDPVFRTLVGFDRAKGEIVFQKNSILNIDDLFTQIIEYLVVNYNLESSIPKIEFIVNKIAFYNVHNSVVIALDTLPPAPPENPLSKIVDHFTTPDNEMLIEIFDLFLKKGALQVYVPEFDRNISFPNDIEPILVGNQGIGKTLFITKLSLSGKYFDAGTLDTKELSSRDGLLKIIGKDIVEQGEFRPGNIDKQKALLSATEYTLRQPYARGNITCPRTASYMGSTNHIHFLSDGTGNRRFFPITVLSIDFDLFNKNVHLFPEVRSYYRDWAKSFINEHKNNLSELLFTIRPSEKLESFIFEAREETRIVSVSEGLIDEYIEKVNEAEKTGNWESFPKRDFKHYLKYYSFTEAALMIYQTGNVPREFTHIFSETMKNHKFLHKTIQISGTRIRVWLPTKESNTAHGTQVCFEDFVKSNSNSIVL